jgi:hypothetical protein
VSPATLMLAPVPLTVMVSAFAVPRTVS